MHGRHSNGRERGNSNSERKKNQSLSKVSWKERDVHGIPRNETGGAKQAGSAGPGVGSSHALVHETFAN